jgi:hypothetical protein
MTEQQRQEEVRQRTLTWEQKVREATPLSKVLVNPRRSKP